MSNWPVRDLSRNQNTIFTSGWLQTDKIDKIPVFAVVKTTSFRTEILRSPARQSTLLQKTRLEFEEARE